MRGWALPLALLALVSFATQVVRTELPELPTVPLRPPPVDPDVLAERLARLQPGWPRHVDCGRAKCVALTFDDGPGKRTGRLLDLLRQRDAKATFFVVGEMVAADGGRTVQRIVADGHELGNHSWSHPALSELTRKELHRELRHTGRLVHRLTGVTMRVMRPPYGLTDKHVAAEARRAGMAQILWNVDTFDWRDRQPKIVARRAGRARPGSIILMHDIHRTTVKAVPALLDALERKGFTFVTVSDLYGDRSPRPGRKYTRR
ncbi:polysaccharide deacetylase family protein [Nonomuraea mesophila]|uniref:Polysaccharide deacetylase family protein n=1 Tax=Nonomuraea mesophila TaxID=2530382 RepID=A0A4R5FXY2_9ACTN|nr:polysaccharide deacetylase family protein [Nonomuraea mesophila]TDE59525.1 polysaccharide deacetylase family protein [Nonomuraea mesophila]